MEAQRFISKLIGESKINEDTKILDFSAPERFEFEAGQYVRMAFYKEGKRILRDYSIFSAPYEKGKISVYFKKVKDGYASNFLFDMKVGEKIEMKGPLGDFVVGDFSKDLIFVSSGTGFGPFMSIIKDLIYKGYRRKMILIRGYRKEESLVCENELKKIKKNNKNFFYHNILSQPNEEDYNLKGHVQEFLEGFIPYDFNGDFYICGLKDMVSDICEKLREIGVSDERIFFERYD
ncbi:FAD-dependent oxidoreductase [Candidatus Pacearchaeota archaeon]|nr:hypothetical protein [uncultured archaeon]MBS3084492.1 FAD-dependent oxidoreductase [Candidatus Pacearchaeota archaeon]